MKKGKIVFLFGAGATLAWNSPTTTELTNLVRKSGFKISDNKTPITEFIFQQLQKNGYVENDINFETIINVIEELTVYYSRFNNDKNLPSLLSCLLTNSFEEEIFNFSVKGGEVQHGFQLQIPKNVDYIFSGYAHQSETPKQFFLMHLLSLVLTNICSRISKFAYHTQGHSVIQTNSSISQNFCNWMKILSDTKILRLYTLNYDRIFKILLERNEIPLFEGFECGEYIPGGTFLRANIPKILSDTECNSYYNLHGSAYWKVIPLDKKQLPNPEIALTSSIDFSVNDKLASFQIEKGKTLLLTSIITGYQKAQKSIITPFRQFYSAFDNDCCFADEVYIIGYSFGDEHINQCLKTAIRYNENLKVIIIDPGFIKGGMDIEFFLKIFPYKHSWNTNPTKVSENLFSYFDGSFIVHTITFEEFLYKERKEL